MNRKVMGRSAPSLHERIYDAAATAAYGLQRTMYLYILYTDILILYAHIRIRIHVKRQHLIQTFIMSGLYC